MRELLNREISRREFLEGTWRVLNVGAFVTIGGFLAGLPLESMASGHPDTMTCYECRACASKCPWRFDPSGFEVAARTNNPNKRMLFQAVLDPTAAYNWNSVIAKDDPSHPKYITLDSLMARDRAIKVRAEVRGEERIMTVEEALTFFPGEIDLLALYEMRAKDAAFYCPLCGNCEPPCPVKLKINDHIRDLKPDGEFR